MHIQGKEVWEGKRYKATDAVNFEEYMKALGVGLIQRSLASRAKPDVVMKRDENGKYTLFTYSAFKNFEVHFKIGEEFEEVTMDGRKVKTTFTWEDGKLVQRQIGDPESTIIREFTENELTTTLNANGITAVRKYVAE